MSRLTLVVALFAALPALADVAPTPMAEAEEKLRRAGRERVTPRREQLVAETMAIARKLITATPTDPEPHILLARALSLADPVHPEVCKPGACEQAVTELENARKLDAHGLDAEKIASEMGIVLSRLGRHEDALAEYDRALK